MSSVLYPQRYIKVRCALLFSCINIKYSFFPVAGGNPGYNNRRARDYIVNIPVIAEEVTPCLPPSPSPADSRKCVV